MFRRRKLELYYAAGGGPCPPHVAWIATDPFEIRFNDGCEQKSIMCDSEADLVDRCQKLAENATPFSVAGMAGGPSEFMLHWQMSGEITISFLQISWLSPGQWQLHEMFPGANQWTSVSFDELVKMLPVESENSDKKGWTRKDPVGSKNSDDVSER